MTGFSSLPLAQEEGHEDQRQTFRGVSRIIGPQWAHLPTITIGLLGVQIFWSVEMSYASPYLLSLGLSKSSMAGVFVAGPLSGLIMQPLIGVLADNCTSRFGRRRPYMMLGTIICIFAMLLLGFTRDVASIFTGWGTGANDALTIWLAVLAIYLIDFSINAVQAVDRALLVDTVPSSDQAAGNAWAARMLGVGSVVGFFVGNINLPRLLPFLGKSQLQVLSVVVSGLLLAGHCIMAIFVKEKVLLKSTAVDGKTSRKSFTQEIKDIMSNIRTLPRIIRQICMVQFFAWIAWFPVLFYSTIYVGDLHKRASPIPADDEAQAALDAEAIRLGSRALFFSALLSLFVNLTLPLFVTEAASAGGTPTRLGRQQKSWWARITSVPRSMQLHLSTLWAVSHFVFATCMMATFFTHSVWGSTLIITATGFSWAVTQWAPFSLLAEAILTEPAAHTAGDSVSIRLTDTRTQPRSSYEPDPEHERASFLQGGDDTSDDEGEVVRQEERRRMLGNSGAQLSRIDIRSPQIHDDEDYEIVSSRSDRARRRERSASIDGGQGGALSAKAGIILGIHNIFIVIPQFLVTGFSAILFALFDPKKPALPAHRGPVAPGHQPVNGTVRIAIGNETIADVAARSVELLRDVVFATRAEDFDESGEEGYSNTVVYIFRIGGIAAAFAFVLCWRLSRELRHR